MNKNDTPDKIINKNKWEKSMDLGVDTGQIGIHDVNHFRNDHDAKNKRLKFYPTSRHERTRRKMVFEKWYSKNGILWSVQ